MVVIEGMPQEHADIAGALRRHDVPGSVAAVEDHITNSYRRYIHMSTRLHVNAGPDLKSAERAAG
jgi:DNA-binding GntR family transcriptional regulator